MSRLGCYVVFWTGAIFEVKDAEDAIQCAKDNGMTVDDFGRYWWYEEHEYDENGEPLGEVPTAGVKEGLT